MGWFGDRVQNEINSVDADDAGARQRAVDVIFQKYFGNPGDKPQKGRFADPALLM